MINVKVNKKEESEHIEQMEISSIMVLWTDNISMLVIFN